MKVELHFRQNEFQNFRMTLRTFLQGLLQLCYTNKAPTKIQIQRMHQSNDYQSIPSKSIPRSGALLLPFIGNVASVAAVKTIDRNALMSCGRQNRTRTRTRSWLNGWLTGSLSLHILWPSPTLIGTIPINAKCRWPKGRAKKFDAHWPGYRNTGIQEADSTESLSTSVEISSRGHRHTPGHQPRDTHTHIGHIQPQGPQG